MDAMTCALRGLHQLQQYLPSPPLRTSEGKRAANIKESGPVRDFYLSLIYNCNTFNGWRTIRRQEINMTPLLVWIFLDREICYLICRKYRKERCLCTAVKLSIKQWKEVRQEFEEQPWAWHFWYFSIIYCLLRSGLTSLCTSQCKGSLWCCHLAENGTMKGSHRLKRQHKMLNKGNIQQAV